jgi:hypothetical protein
MVSHFPNLQYHSNLIDPTLNPKQYYDELLNATVVDEDGCYSIGPTHLSNMIDLYISFPETPKPSIKLIFLKVTKYHFSYLIPRIRNEEDLDIVIEAYYNFKGHKTIFSNKIVDKLVSSSIEINKPEKVFDVSFFDFDCDRY